MAQYISPGNIFGRIGSGIGKGLSEQLPEEIGRGRLSSGLKQFEQESSNLNPMQQLARLSSIPGITPQMIQSFSELAKHQNLRDAYSRQPIQGQSKVARSSPDFREMEFNQGKVQRENEPTQVNRMSLKEERDLSSPGIIKESPLDEKQLARIPWDRDKKNKRINSYIGMGFLPDKAEQLAHEDEQVYLSEPDVYEKRYSKQKERMNEARSELDREVKQLLQVDPEDKTGIFNHITGEMKSNLEKSMERDLRLNPGMSIQDSSRKWGSKALDLAKAKTQLNEMSSTKGIGDIFRGREPLNKLKQYSKIFSETGNSEEYQNLLRSDMDMSPQGSASVAYPVSNDFKDYISKIKSSSKVDPYENASKVALEVANLISPEDSIQSIVAHIKEHDPFFDEKAFFDQLRTDQDNLSLNPRQKRELAQGAAGSTRYWGDVLIFPWIGKR